MLGVGGKRAAVLTEEKLGQQPELASSRAPSSAAWVELQVPQIPEYSILQEAKGLLVGVFSVL